MRDNFARAWVFGLGLVVSVLMWSIDQRLDQLEARDPPIQVLDHAE